MRQAPPAIRDLARRLLARSAKQPQGAAELAEAVAKGLQSLQQQLTRLIGPEGFGVLVGRSLHLASVEFPFLKGVEAEVGPVCSLKGLRERLESVAPADANAAAAALLGNLIWLLVAFIGLRLTLRLLQSTWPEVALGDAGPGLEEAR